MVISSSGAPISGSRGELPIMQGCGGHTRSILGASCPCEKSYSYLCPWVHSVNRAAGLAGRCSSVDGMVRHGLLTSESPGPAVTGWGWRHGVCAGRVGWGHCWSGGGCPERGGGGRSSPVVHVPIRRCREEAREKGLSGRFPAIVPLARPPSTQGINNHRGAFQPLPGLKPPAPSPQSGFFPTENQDGPLSPSSELKQ